MVSIRPEKPSDKAGVRAVNELAFGQQDEADIVDRIRDACDNVLSLVAVSEGLVVGHILFSPASIATQNGVVEGMGLAPMAVRPEYQRQRVGSALVEAGLDILRRRPCAFVIVLGHPEYYPRFGFEPASKHGVSCQWEGVPDEAFMILVIGDSTLKAVTGVARYREEFDQTV
jgi:putative acetyltransferase